MSTLFKCCAALAPFLAWLPAEADLITYRLEADKTEVLPGEEITMSLYAFIDPGPGGQGMWNNGQPPQLGTVYALNGCGFNMICEGRDISWTGYLVNPELYFFTELAIFSKNGLKKASVLNFKKFGYPTYVAQDNWVMSFKFAFEGNEHGQATFLGDQSYFTGGIWFDVPGQSGLVGGGWATALEPLVFTIIPAPGAAPLVALAAAFTMLRRRRD